MAATIVDVAAKAGVSISTASRILNGGTKGRRRDAVGRAQAVLAAAKELRYQPNRTARGLVLKRSFTIGVVVTEIHNPVRTRMIDALRSLAFQRGFAMLVASVNRGEDPVGQLNNLLNHQVDGLILTHLPQYPDEQLRQLRECGIPVVGFGIGGASGFDNIAIDYSRAAYELTCHLLEHHRVRRVVFAGGMEKSLRYEGYCRAMQMHALEAAPLLRAERVTLESGRLLGRQLTAAGPVPEAIVCHNDIFAMGVIAGFRESGVLVPRDVRVTGIDNIEFASYSNPRLTTAGVEGEMLAEELCERLFRQIDGESAEGARETELPIRFFFRESCGCRPVPEPAGSMDRGDEK